MSHPYTEILLTCLEPDEEIDEEVSSSIQDLLSEALLRARDRWPSFVIEDEHYLSYLAEKLSPSEPLFESLQQLHLEDLYLACACIAKDKEALTILQKDYFQTLQLQLKGLANHEELEIELRQQVWERVCHAVEKAPKILLYAGSGPLKAWLQTILTREALGVLRKAKKERPAGDELFWRLASPQDDQEQLYLKELYKDAFKDAFQQALQDLSAKERNILKYHYLDGLNIDKIGLLYRVHRATIARWLVKIREDLMQSTFTHMNKALGVSEEAAKSVFRMIQSQIDVSLFRMLKK